MAESNPVFESFINKVCFTDTSAPVNCNQFSFITVVNFMKFFNFVFSTDHNLSIKCSYEAVNIKKVFLTDQKIAIMFFLGDSSFPVNLSKSVDLRSRRYIQG